MKAKFITLEGIESSGKSTSIKTINKVLDTKLINYINTREPGGSPLGKRLRKFLLNPNSKISNEVELLLMLADRKDHVEKIILPHLSKNTWVISDRYMDSTLAYQGGGRELSSKDIELVASFLNIPSPNLTLLFDLPVEIALDRAYKRGSLDRFEQEDIDFHKRIREKYLELAKKFPQRIKVLDTSKEVGIVQQKV